MPTPEKKTGMAETMAKLFIVTALFFFLVGCIEGLLFTAKFELKSVLQAALHIDPAHLKLFFGYFVTKIHTHVNLIGWVGSAIMGILYFLSPRISGSDRYITWVAYGNWGCNTFGILLMAIGFHLIGIYGLSSGFAPGTVEFRAVASPFKKFVAAGGILITVSAVLFAWNMLRTLFAWPAETTAT